MAVQNFPETDPRYHTGRIRKMLGDISAHLREDVSKVNDPRAQAMFETSAEVIDGLTKAFEDYESKAEKAWK